MITGPSGVGKGTLIRSLFDRVPELGLSVSATTRAPRPGEQDGVPTTSSHRDEFDARVAAGDFVEWAEYSGNRYGTLRSELERRSRGGHRRSCSRSRSRAPARCARRCPRRCRSSSRRRPARRCARGWSGRGTDTAEQVQRRLETAAAELAAQPEFQHVVVNDRLEDAVDALVAIVRGELTASCKLPGSPWRLRASTARCRAA